MPRKTAVALPPRRHLLLASMRPRPDAAENPRTGGGSDDLLLGFNEAAARCRGKPAERDFAFLLQDRGFNEAAARCRGKPSRTPACNAWPTFCFNEAAARCRGKPAAEIVKQHGDWVLQ